MTGFRGIYEAIHNVYSYTSVSKPNNSRQIFTTNRNRELEYNLLHLRCHTIFKIPSRQNADCVVVIADTYNLQSTLKKHCNKTFYTLNYII
jgi:hypothetical protein